MLQGRIHVAGVIDQAEAEMLIGCGVDCLGFPFRLAKHKEDLPEDEAAQIIRSFPSHVMPLLITYLIHAEEIIGLSNKLGVRNVQLHGNVTVQELARLKELAPSLGIIKSLIVRANNLADLKDEIHASVPYVDSYITDTFDPETGATGATGKTHDWSVSRSLVEFSPHPLILAGGLNPDNVREAIHQVRPAGVDVHTGIEGPDGRKDRNLTLRFVAETRKGYAEIDGCSETWSA